MPQVFARGGLHWWIAGGAMLVAVFAFGLLSYRPRLPLADELVYLRHALALSEHGVFSSTFFVDGPSPPPDGYVGPGYPFLISLLLPLDAGLEAMARCLLRGLPGCRPGIGIVYPVQLAIAAVGGFLVYVAGVLLFANRWLAAFAAALYLFATEVPVHFANHVLTENLTLPLGFATSLALLVAVRRRSPGWFAAAGALLALTALVRPPFFHLGLICAIAATGLALLWPRRRGRGALLGGAVAFAVGLAVVAGPWIARNTVQTGIARFNVGYGHLPLSSRIAYNQMTAREWLAGWIYALPDFGDKLSVHLFGERAVRRLNLSGPDSFARGITGELRQAMRKEARAGGEIWWLVSTQILDRPLRHLAVSLMLAWQGAFVAKYFGLVGVFALIWAVGAGTAGAARRDLVVLALPSVLMLGFQANLSVSIPRYNLPLLLPMALAITLMLWRAAGWLRPRRAAADRTP